MKNAAAKNGEWHFLLEMLEKCDIITSKHLYYVPMRRVAGAAKLFKQRLEVFAKCVIQYQASSMLTRG